MSNIKKEIRISDSPEVTLQRIDAPHRGAVFYGPILAVRGANETYAAYNLDKLTVWMERKEKWMSRWEAAKTVAKPMVREADRAIRVWTGAGFTRELRDKLLWEIAAAIIERYEE